MKVAIEGPQAGTDKSIEWIKFIYHDHQEVVKQWLHILFKSMELRGAWVA